MFSSQYFFQCLTADFIFSTLGLENADGLTEEEFAEAAYLIAYAMLQKSEEGSCPGSFLNGF